MKKIIAVLIVLFGVWMVFWEPVDAVTTYLGPFWSFVGGIAIIIAGAVFWKIKAF